MIYIYVCVCVCVCVTVSCPYAMDTAQNHIGLQIIKIAKILPFTL